MRPEVGVERQVATGTRALASMALGLAIAIASLVVGLSSRTYYHSQSTFVAMAAVLGLVTFIVWSSAVPRSSDRKIVERSAGIVAGVLAMVFVLYAIAKIYGGQFGRPLQTELDTTLRDLSGFQLTWRFFGHSFGYVLFIAGGQLAAAVLLTFRRTRLLGACVFLPIMANIVVVNFTHGIPVRLFASLLLLLDLYLLIALGGRRLVSFFLGGAAPPIAAYRTSRWWALSKAAALGAFIVFTSVQFSALMNDVFRPSAIHGTWDVAHLETDREAGEQALSDWRRVYFEDLYLDGTHFGAARVPAGLVRFRYSMDTDSKRLVMTLPSRSIRGTYEREGDVLVIRGTIGDSPMELRLSLAYE